MSTTPEYPQTLHADREHDSLRLVVLLLIVIGILIGYLLISMLIRLYASPGVREFSFLISCVGGIPLGLGLSWFVERILLQYWHSGNSITLDARQICWRWRGSDDYCVQLDAETAVTSWHFPLGGFARGGSERRAPKNWHCLALQVQRSDDRLLVFALTSPAELDRLGSSFAFETLRPAEVYGQKSRSMRAPTRPDISPEVLRGPHGRYWLAERRRWMEGMELNHEDFEQFLSFLRASAQQNEIHFAP